MGLLSSHRRISAPIVAIGLGALLATTGCGTGASEESPRRGNEAERAFLQAMVPHHVSATQMARVAATEGDSSFVKALAGDIVRTQSTEVEQMKRIHQRLFAEPLMPDEDAHVGLGLSPTEAGMEHMGAAGMIRGQRPFDRAFIDEMVPHHRGAIAMAEAVLAKTPDVELRRLARGIVAAQEAEIARMNDHRERRYGAPGTAKRCCDGEKGGR